jgi:spoIIIJ-associated protein
MLESQQNEKNERSMEKILETTRQIIKRLQLDLSVNGEEEKEYITINLSGYDRHYLLSGSASLLNSLEYLLNRMYRKGKDESAGIILDSDGYREHRKSELILLAQMATKKVLTMKKPLGLQPMSPRERRIIHMALAEIEGVHSKSTGEGDHRSITIFPS